MHIRLRHTYINICSIYYMNILASRICMHIVQVWVHTCIEVDDDGCTSGSATAMVVEFVVFNQSINQFVFAPVHACNSNRNLVQYEHFPIRNPQLTGIQRRKSQVDTLTCNDWSIKYIGEDFELQKRKHLCLRHINRNRELHKNRRYHGIFD